MNAFEIDSRVAGPIAKFLGARPAPPPGFTGTRALTSFRYALPPLVLYRPAFNRVDIATGSRNTSPVTPPRDHAQAPVRSAPARIFRSLHDYVMNWAGRTSVSEQNLRTGDGPVRLALLERRANGGRILCHSERGREVHGRSADCIPYLSGVPQNTHRPTCSAALPRRFFSQTALGGPPPGDVAKIFDWYLAQGKIEVNLIRPWTGPCSRSLIA